MGSCMRTPLTKKDIACRPLLSMSTWLTHALRERERRVDGEGHRVQSLAHSSHLPGIRYCYIYYYMLLHAVTNYYITGVGDERAALDVHLL